MAWRHIAQDGLIEKSPSDTPGGGPRCSWEVEPYMDGIVNVLQYAVDGVAQQQQATANNLANSETPGYTAQTVSFEDSLSSAISSGDPSQAQITTGVTAPLVSAALCVGASTGALPSEKPPD